MTTLFEQFVGCRVWVYLGTFISKYQSKVPYLVPKSLT
jgi:hypothetical protein